MVTEQLKSSTPMQEWVAQALERMQPILDGSELTDRYFEVEKEAMRDILNRVEWLVQHFQVMPEPCHADHSEIFRAGGVAALNSVVATMKVMPEPWDFHPHEEDGV